MANSVGSGGLQPQDLYQNPQITNSANIEKQGVTEAKGEKKAPNILSRALNSIIKAFKSIRPDKPSKPISERSARQLSSNEKNAPPGFNSAQNVSRNSLLDGLQPRFEQDELKELERELEQLDVQDESIEQKSGQEETAANKDSRVANWQKRKFGQTVPSLSERAENAVLTKPAVSHRRKTPMEQKFELLSNRINELKNLPNDIASQLKAEDVKAEIRNYIVDYERSSTDVPSLQAHNQLVTKKLNQLLNDLTSAFPDANSEVAEQPLPEIVQDSAQPQAKPTDAEKPLPEVVQDPAQPQAKPKSTIDGGYKELMQRVKQSKTPEERIANLKSLADRNENLLKSIEKHSNDPAKALRLKLTLTKNLKKQIQLAWQIQNGIENKRSPEVKELKQVRKTFLQQSENLNKS